MDLTKALGLVLQLKEGYNVMAITELEKMVKDEIGLQLAKNNKQTSMFKTLKRLIEENKKEVPDMTAIHGVWRIDNKQYFTDRYCLIQINTPLEGLPEVELSPATANLHKIHFSKDYSNYLQYDLDINSVKMLLKEAEAKAKTERVKNKKSYVYKNTKIQIGINKYPAVRILDIYNILGSDMKVYYEEIKEEPCYFESDFGKALLMPFHFS